MSIKSYVCSVKLVQSMTCIERVASLLAAISHDIDHPGTNQSFLIATSNPLAQLYQVLTAYGIFTETSSYVVRAECLTFHFCRYKVCHASRTCIVKSSDIGH